MRKFFSHRQDAFHPNKYDVENNIEAMVANIHDPLGFMDTPGAYVDHHWSPEQCLDAVVAGVSETLGLPTGLSFDELFAKIG